MVIFVWVQPERSRDDEPPSGSKVLQASVQQWARIMEVFENFSQHYSIEEAGHWTFPDKVPFDQPRVSAHLIRFLGQQLASVLESVWIDLYTRNVDASAREKNLHDSFAATHVQHLWTLGLVDHPVDSTAEHLTGGAPVNCTEVHLRDLVSDMCVVRRIVIICF